MAKMGRPKTWDNPEKMKAALEEYFDNTADEDITWCGMCLHIGVTRQTFINYAKDPAFREIVRHAHTMVENEYEKSLRKHGRSGDIFALKNFNWTDKQEIEQHSVNINKNIDISKLSNEELQNLEKLIAKCGDTPTNND